MLELEQKKPLIFSDENEEKLNKVFEQYKGFYSKLWAKIIKLIVSFVPILVKYLILSFIFLSMLEWRGFEQTIILIGVTVIVTLTGRGKVDAERINS